MRIALDSLPTDATMLQQLVRDMAAALDDGRIDLDNNPVERAIRPIALGRKNALSAGSGGGAKRWAIVASLIETAKLNGVEPYAWLRDTLTRMVDVHSNRHLAELTPFGWLTSNP